MLVVAPRTHMPTTSSTVLGTWRRIVLIAVALLAALRTPRGLPPSDDYQHRAMLGGRRLVGAVPTEKGVYIAPSTHTPCRKHQPLLQGLKNK